LGYWKVESFTVNGVDSISELTCDQYYFDYPDNVGATCDPKDSTYFNGTWEFVNHKKGLQIFGNSSSDRGKTAFVTSDVLEWEVMRLTERQLWLKVKFNNKEYYDKFGLINN
jgi:hypothetical protein